MSYSNARHCSAEDSETTEVYEVDSEFNLSLTITQAAAFIKELDGKIYTVEYHEVLDDPEPFQCFLFKVEK